MELSLISVFVAGVFSFFSPCIIPLIPMYIGFLAGDIGTQKKHSKALYLNAFGFLMGLMLVFIALGAMATALGSLLLERQQELRKISGILIAVMGFFQLGVVQFSFLKKNRQMRVRYRGSRFLTAVLMGMAFSFGWTPCVGPILASVLLYAANAETLGTGITLLVAYSMGFIVPFVVSTILMDRATSIFDKSEKWLVGLKRLSGGIMILVGILIYFNYLSRIIAWIS